VLSSRTSRLARLIDGRWSGDGQRAVSARIGYTQLVVGIKLFGCIDRHQSLAFRGPSESRPPVVVQDKLRVDQFAMILDQPVYSIRFPALFVWA